MSVVKLPSRPRWGIFSSAVFSDPGKLAADVLLYDRLVLPVPTDDDRERWHKKGWRPDDIAGYLKDLDTMAIDVEWSTVPKRAGHGRRRCERGLS